MLALRQATAADLAIVRCITHEAYAPWERFLGGPPLPMHEDYAPRIARRDVWIVDCDGEDAGVMVLEPAADHLLIYSLAMASGHQGRGIGRWMIAAAEQMARVARLPELRLYTNDRMTRNLTIYRQAGFHETGRRPNPYREGWILVDMVKEVFPELKLLGEPVVQLV